MALPDQEFDASEIEIECEDEAGQSSCPHEIIMAPHECDAMDWLFKTLTQIAKKRDHANFARASAALTFIGRLAKSQRAVHLRVHELEHVLAVAGAAAMGPPNPDAN